MTTNTKKSFHDKWHNNQQLAFSETNCEDSEIFQWILNRNGFANIVELQNFLSRKRRILDAGCGNGRITALLRANSDPAMVEVVAIDLVAASIADKNLAQYKNLSVREADLLGDLTSLGEFDFIYCQEVLHHTSDPRRAFQNLVNLLLPGGEIAIYVYCRKAPPREFVDDFVRNKIAEMPYEESIQHCKQIAELGRVLSELNVKVSIPKVELLEIEEGEYDIQRFIYHFFMKCFWNQRLTPEENAAINYDWYHPQDCTRHTIEEIRQWFDNPGLKIVHESKDFYGITIRGLAQT